MRLRARGANGLTQHGRPEEKEGKEGKEGKGGRGEYKLRPTERTIRRGLV